MVGCRNTSTNYRETGIRGHPAATQRARASSGPANELAPSSTPELIKPDLRFGRGLYAPRPRERDDTERNVKFHVVPSFSVPGRDVFWWGCTVVGPSKTTR